MISTYNVGDIIPLAALFVDRAGNSLTGSITIIVEVFRPADAYFLDWNDGTFKASGWTTKQAAVPEVSASNAAGWYKKATDWNTSGVAPGSYFITYRDTSGAAGNPVQQDEIRLVDSPTSLVSGTASAGSANSITLAGASSTDGFYKRQNVAIVGGTGAGQVRPILHYVGSTNVATVGPAWATNPDSTSRYSVTTSYNAVFVDCGLAQAGGASTITLASTSSSTNDIYVGCEVMVLSGTGAGQNRVISAYNGSTKVATVATAWAVQPDSTSAYALLPVGRSIAVSVLDKTGYGVSAIAADALDAAAVKADAVTKIQSGLATRAMFMFDAEITSTVDGEQIYFPYFKNGAPVVGAPVKMAISRQNPGGFQTLDFSDEIFVLPADNTYPLIDAWPLSDPSKPGLYTFYFSQFFPQNAVTPDVYTCWFYDGAELVGMGRLRVGMADIVAALPTNITDARDHIEAAAATGFAEIKGADFTAGVDDLHSIRARGDASWVTASVAGLATSQNVTDAVAAIEAYGQLHWETAVGFAVPGSAMTLANGALTSTAIGAGFVNAIQANLALEASLTAIKGAGWGAGDNLHAILAAVGALPNAAAIAAALGTLDVSANENVFQVGGILYALKQIALNDVAEVEGNPGSLVVKKDDGVTPRFTFALRDASGGAVVADVGSPAQRSAAT